MSNVTSLVGELGFSGCADIDTVVAAVTVIEVGATVVGCGGVGDSGGRGSGGCN